jgi:hypothetical protein
MANISIVDLKSAGSGFFSHAESFVDSMQDLSENELKMTFGGKGHYGSGRGGSRRSGSGRGGSGRSGSGNGSCGCGHNC